MIYAEAFRHKHQNGLRMMATAERDGIGVLVKMERSARTRMPPGAKNAGGPFGGQAKQRRRQVRKIGLLSRSLRQEISSSVDAPWYDLFAKQFGSSRQRPDDIPDAVAVAPTG